MNDLQRLLEWIEKYEVVNGTPTICEIKAQIGMLLLEQNEVNKFALGGVIPRFLGIATDLTAEASRLDKDDADDIKSCLPCKCFETNIASPADGTLLVWLEGTAKIRENYIHKDFLLINEV